MDLKIFRIGLDGVLADLIEIIYASTALHNCPYLSSWFIRVPGDSGKMGACGGGVSCYHFRLTSKSQLMEDITRP